MYRSLKAAIFVAIIFSTAQGLRFQPRHVDSIPEDTLDLMHVEVDNSLGDERAERIIDAHLLTQAMRGREKHMPSAGISPDASWQGKWLYFRGDSTTRQVVADFLGRVGVNMSQEALYDFVHHSDKCTRPPHSADYKHWKKHTPHHGYGYSSHCERNEKICHWAANGTRLTYDWQHFVFDEREQYLFSNESKAVEFKDGMPDAFIVGVPIHVCFHTSAVPLWDKSVTSKPAQRHEYISQLPQLLAAIRSVHSGPLFWLEAAGLHPRQPEYMDCTTQVNAALRSVTETDANSIIIPRQAIESEWLVGHPADESFHKPEKCVSLVAQKLQEAMRTKFER